MKLSFTVGNRNGVDLSSHARLKCSLDHYFDWLYGSQAKLKIHSVHAYKKCSVNGMDLVAHPEEDVAEQSLDDSQSNFPMDVVEIYFQQEGRGQLLRMERWFARQLLFLEVKVRIGQEDGRFSDPIVHELSYHNLLERSKVHTQEFDKDTHLPVVNRTFYNGDHIADVRRIVSQAMAIPLTRWSGVPLRAKERQAFFKAQNVLLIPFPYLIRHTRQ